MDAREDELIAQIAAIAAELAAMPLATAHRDRRLALNQQREKLEQELEAQRRRGAIERELAMLVERLALPVSDGERRALKRRQRELLIQLEQLSLS